MAEVPDIGGDAGSNLVQGAGSATSVYTFPGNIGQQAESVVATIDNTGGGDQTVTLTVRDSSGEVIATRVQPDAIPAGDTGTATWALRLDDNSGAGIRFRKENTGAWLHVTTTGTSGFGGIVLNSDGGDFRIFTGTGDQFRVDSEFIVLHTAGGEFRILDSGETFMDMGGGASWQFTDWALTATSGQVTIQLANGSNLEVQDHSGNPIFRVDEDGDLHGLTGKSLVFDL